jgi:SseB protein N-terminal domain
VAALAAFAAGTGSEHAALTALAGTRLLVPVVAAAVPDEDGSEPGPAGGEKTSQMSIPTLIGQDSRPAIPAFTSLAALAAWQASARPVPAGADSVWRSAATDGCAVVLDIAGPVPLAVDGARLAALAAGQPVPRPPQDPDVHAVVAAVAGAHPEITAVRLSDGIPPGDLTVELTIVPGPPAQGQDLARQAGGELLARLGGRVRRGLAVTIAADH